MPVLLLVSVNYILKVDFNRSNAIECYNKSEHHRLIIQEPTLVFSFDISDWLLQDKADGPNYANITIDNLILNFETQT